MKAENPQRTITESLPTTPEIVSQGVNILKEILPKASPWTRNIILGHQQIIPCILGLTPEVGSGNLLITQIDHAIISDLQTLLQPYSDQLTLAQHAIPIPTPTEQTRYFLLNITAATHCIRQHPDLFPAVALSNPAQWIQENTQQWYYSKRKTHPTDAAQIDVRYGILSGYPRYAAEQYYTFKNATDKLLNTYPEVGDVYIDYLYNHDRFNPSMRKTLRKILAKLEEVLTPTEIDLLVSAYFVHTPFLSYTGFEPKKDQKYVQNITQLYESSKITEVIPQKYRRNTL